MVSFSHDSVVERSAEESRDLQGKGLPKTFKILLSQAAVDQTPLYPGCTVKDLSLLLFCQPLFHQFTETTDPAYVFLYLVSVAFVFPFVPFCQDLVQYSGLKLP